MSSSGARMFIAAQLLLSIAMLTPAAAQAPVIHLPNAGACRPTALDFVVLASFADSSSMISLSAYRATGSAHRTSERNAR